MLLLFKKRHLALFLVFFTSWVSLVDAMFLSANRLASKVGYKNIVFDLGQVLVNSDYDEMATSFAGNSSPLQTKLVCAGEDPVWDDLDRRSVTPEMLIDTISEKFDIDKTCLTQFVEKLPNYHVALAPGVTILQAVKNRGYKVYYLSNMADFCFAEVSRAPFFALFDGGVCSYHCCSNKPQKEIYEYFLKKHNLRPDECLFLDDRRKNVEGGLRVGIDGIVYENPRDVVETLKKIGILAEDFKW